MYKSKTSFFIIGILVAMLAASLITVLVLYLSGGLASELVKLEFTLRPVAAKEYDGTPLKPNGYDWTSGKLKEGHKMEITTIGEQTDCGTSESDLLINIYDENGYNANSQYAIKVNKSSLTVTPRKLTIYLLAQDIPYSGQEVQITDYMIFKGTGLAGDIKDFEAGELMQGHKLFVCFPGFENVGDVLPNYTKWKSENFKIYDTYGNLVTKNYELNASLIGGGKIQIVPRRIKVNALDVEKSYDGTSVTGKFELASGKLAPGHFIGKADFTDEYDKAVSVIDAGESASVKVSAVTVYAQDGYDVVPLSAEMQKNYEIDLQDPVYAVWSVTPRKITPRLKDWSVIYSGETYSPIITELIDSLTIPVPSALEGKAHELRELTNGSEKYFEVLCDREIRDAGTYLYRVRLTEAGEEIFGQGNIVCDDSAAKITVTKMNVNIVYGGTTEKNYDGTEMAFDRNALSVRNMENAELDNFSVSTAEFFYKTSGDRTFGNHSVGLNNVHIARRGDSFQDATANLQVSVSEINITINKAQLKAVYTGTLSKVYDGKEITIDNNDFSVVDASTNRTLSAFYVQSATVKYVTAEGVPDMATEHLTAGNYTLQMDGVKIALKDNPTKDLTSYITANAQNFNYTIERAGLTVLSAGGEVFMVTSEYVVESSVVESMKQTLAATLNWQGLLSGDEISLSGAVASSSTGDVYTFTVDWDSVNIYRRDASGALQNVKDSYNFENKDCTVYTMTFMYA